MAAYAEIVNILKNARVGLHALDQGAGTSPLRDRRATRCQIDLDPIADVRLRRGVTAWWRPDPTAKALAAEEPYGASFHRRRSDSGDGRWTRKPTIEAGVPTPGTRLALGSRFESRRNADHAGRVLFALRMQLAGRDEKKARS